MFNHEIRNNKAKLFKSYLHLTLPHVEKQMYSEEFEIGFGEGRKKEKEEIAKRLMQLGFCREIILKAIDMDVESFEKLSRENNYFIFFNS